MTGAIRFKFRSNGERDEFLGLNDLRLVDRRGEIIDWDGHPVGRLAIHGDGSSLLEIRDGCHQGLRPARWWRRSC